MPTAKAKQHRKPTTEKAESTPATATDKMNDEEKSIPPAETPHKVKEPTASSVQAFFTVTFEYFFVFLLGFFVGCSCSLVLAVYIVAIIYKSCDQKTAAVNGTAIGDTEKADCLSCYKLFFIFIASCTGVFVLFCLFKSIRWLYKNKANKEAEVDAKTAAAGEESTENQPKMDAKLANAASTSTLKATNSQVLANPEASSSSTGSIVE